MKTTDLLGKAGGWALAPITSMVAALRRSRMFHPDGVVLLAGVEPAAEDDALKPLAEKLAGHALVRLSSAWWRAPKEWPDDLGLAIRFRKSAEVSEKPDPDDQDLLLATIRSPLTTVLAVLSTHVHDFLANDYYGVSPFEVEGVGRMKWRAVSSRPETHGETRVDKLLGAVKGMGALFTLEAKREGGKYQPVAKIRLVQQVDVDQSKLRFDPFRDARGLQPVGFVQKLRLGAYAGSLAGSRGTRFRMPQTEQSAV